MSIVVNNARWPGVSNNFGDEDLSFTVYLPLVFKEPLDRLIEKCNTRHNSYIHLVFDAPRKPRSTGPGSQCNHLHGHLQQIAQHVGISMTDVKDFMKRDCPWWPQHIIKVGMHTEILPISEADVDSATEAKAIAWCHQAALDCGITLRED